MREQGKIAGTLFCAAAALTAAALTDPILEALSNAGVFGPGRFTDRSTVDVIPALCIAVALAFVVLLRRLRLWEIQAPITPLSGIFTKIYPMQIAMLFAMESVEQIAIAGHPLGGTLWLGAPVLISLAAHLASCLVVTWGLSRLLRWSARAIVRIVQAVFVFLHRRTAGATHAVRVGAAPLPRSIEPYLRALHGRAPPAIPAAPTH